MEHRPGTDLETLPAADAQGEELLFGNAAGRADRPWPIRVLLEYLSPAAAPPLPRRGPRPPGTLCATSCAAVRDGRARELRAPSLFHRVTNLTARAGQTPPHDWQKVQSPVRVVKSSWTASNGQISTHLPQPMHVIGNLALPHPEQTDT